MQNKGPQAKLVNFPATCDLLRPRTLLHPTWLDPTHGHHLPPTPPSRDPALTATTAAVVFYKSRLLRVPPQGVGSLRYGMEPGDLIALN